MRGGHPADEGRRVSDPLFAQHEEALRLRAAAAAREAATWPLEFHPSTETPTERGDYLLYNQCDGYHIAEYWDGQREQHGIEPGFRFFAAPGIVGPDFYSAWAKLPNTLTDLYPRFARRNPRYTR
jgi:hypothetical protein